MRIKNQTVLSKELLLKFNLDNLFHKLKFNVVIFPFIIIASALWMRNIAEEQIWLTNIMILIAVLTPLSIMFINLVLALIQIKNYIKLDQTTETEFDKKGIYIKPCGNEILIPYDYIKECVEYSTTFVFYFRGAAPIVIEKCGFKFGNYKPFKDDMQEYIGGKCKFKNK